MNSLINFTLDNGIKVNADCKKDYYTIYGTIKIPQKMQEKYNLEKKSDLLKEIVFTIQNECNNIKIINSMIKFQIKLSMTNKFNTKEYNLEIQHYKNKLEKYLTDASTTSWDNICNTIDSLQYIIMEKLKNDDYRLYASIYYSEKYGSYETINTIDMFKNLHL